MPPKKQQDAMSKKAQKAQDQALKQQENAAQKLAEKAGGDAESDAVSVTQGENYPAGDIIEGSTEENAVVTTETRSLTGRTFEAQSKSENPRFYAVPRDKAYGAATKEELARSGYSLPDYFFDGESTALAQHKMPGNGHAEGGAEQE